MRRGIKQLDARGPGRAPVGSFRSGTFLPSGGQGGLAEHRPVERRRAARRRTPKIRLTRGLRLETREARAPLGLAPRVRARSPGNGRHPACSGLRIDGERGRLSVVGLPGSEPESWDLS